MDHGKFLMKNILISLDVYNLRTLGMELENLLRNLLYRLESIDDEGKSTVIEDKINKLSHQIGQLKSDLSEIASLFHLLKSDKDILTLQKIEKLENCSIDKVEADNNERNIDNKTEYDVSTSTQSDIQASPLLGNARKEIIKDFKQHTFIGYVKKVSKGNVQIVLDNLKIINIPYSSKWGKYCSIGSYVAIYQLEEEEHIASDWEVLRFLSAKRNYNITHPNGENETIIENKTFYSKKQLNNKLHIGDILEIVVTKIGINFCEVYSEKKNVYAYIPCKEPAYMYKEGHRFFVKITGYNSNKDMYIVKECDHK